MVRSQHFILSCVTWPLALGALLVACSGESRDVSRANGDGGAPAFVTGDSARDETGAGAVGAVTPGSACATASAGATRPPVHLVFMYDRSFSMGFAVGSTTVWEACKAGLSAFFASPSSSGLHASLAFFGKDDTLDSALTCSASSYATPEVPMTALPNGTLFANAIGATKPFTGTPTLPALTGAIQYGKKVKAGLAPNEKVAVVLVTDGAPTGCTDNTLTTVHDAAQSAAQAAIPTYVVGIGKVANLQTIASGGGTTAVEVSTTSPAQVTTDIEAALGQIGAAELGCEYALPPPPAGQAIDVNAVNVNYTPANGSATTLPYSATCADAGGWHYDNVQAPTKIVACPASCATLEADRGGKMDIIFGCTTSIPPGGAPPIPK